MDRYFVIINKKAGNGKGQKIWEELKETLARSGIDHRSFFTDYPGHAEHLALQITELAYRKKITVVVIGGDGTLNEVINGLGNYPDIPIKFIPAGTCNDFARSLQIRDKLLTNPIETIDVGSYQLTKKDRLFVSSLGIGLDAEIARHANQFFLKPILSKFKVGALTYIILLLKYLFTYEPSKVSLVIDGQTYHYKNCYLVTVSNLPYYGGGMKISPTANPKDGKLNICVAHDVARWKILFIFAAVFLGKHDLFKEIKMLTGKQIKVQSENALPIHVDGEYAGKTPVSITVKERKIKVML